MGWPQGTPVRRHSYRAGWCERGFWRPTRPGILRGWLLAARAPAGGPRRVLEALAGLQDWATGRLDPTYDFLQARLGCSRDSLARWLRQLRDAGLIDWIRRFKVVDGMMRQTSNAYRLLGVAPALACPVPDDHAHAQAERAAQLNAWGPDGKLGAALDRLGEAVRDRTLTRVIDSRAAAT